jgi:hypothetical protein
MKEEQFAQVQAEVDEKCIHLRNISRWQEDGNFDYKCLEKLPIKVPKQKRNGKLRRYETIYITRPNPMQNPTPEHTHHIEIPGKRGEPIDVRLKHPQTGTAHAYPTCNRCGKKIVRGKTAKAKSIPISEEIWPDGKPNPIAHWDDCPNAGEFKKGKKNLVSNTPLFS